MDRVHLVFDIFMNEPNEWAKGFEEWLLQSQLKL